LWNCVNHVTSDFWVPWHLDLCTKVLEYWMISSLKLKLNHSWKFSGELRNVPLVLLERSWRGGFNGICLVRFGFKMWETLMAYHSIQAWFHFIFGCSSKSIRTLFAKQCSHVEFPYFVMGSHLGKPASWWAGYSQAWAGALCIHSTLAALTLIILFRGNVENFNFVYKKNNFFVMENIESFEIFLLL